MVQPEYTYYDKELDSYWRLSINIGILDGTYIFHFHFVRARASKKPSLGSDERRWSGRIRKRGRREERDGEIERITVRSRTRNFEGWFSLRGSTGEEEGHGGKRFHGMHLYLRIYIYPWLQFGVKERLPRGALRAKGVEGWLLRVLGGVRIIHHYFLASRNNPCNAHRLCAR